MCRGKSHCVRVLLPTTDFPPMTGGIQLLLDRLVSHSRHHFDVVAPAALGLNYAQGASANSVRRCPRVRSHRTEVALLNALTVDQALKRRPDVLLSGHIVLGPAALVSGRLVRSPVVEYVYAKELTARPTLAGSILSRVHATIAISGHTRALATSLSANPETLDVIMPGCDPPVAPVPPLKERGGPPTIVTVARLADRYKGFDVMLRAMPLVRARVPDARWVLVGDGPLKSTLMATARSWGIADACVFAGHLSDEQRDQWLDRAHVFAMPSRVDPSTVGGSEGFGIVYLEAGAHRLPIVGGLVGGSTDAVIDGVTGILVDAADHVAVAGALCTLLSDRELATRLGEAGARRADELSWQRMANAVDDLLEGVVRDASALRRSRRAVSPDGKG
jgi:glycosyltransferase involved in cell wall biosynthesis